MHIYEEICLEVIDNRKVFVHGRGRAYYFVQIGEKRYTTIAFEPGDAFVLE